MQGGCIADIGSCGTGFDSASGSVRTKKFRTKGSELADRKGEKNKAMPRAPSICCSSIDEALSFLSRARCNKRLALFNAPLDPVLKMSFALLGAGRSRGS
ncbi:uncharacterized protein LOC125536229 [Triticum urartu]|uniref:uncharacterized protein LOC125530334 n=1 Tax=Triticum urartu TaxID=4572 RepID=UPI002044486D|nr:uncharacterized protein LOC125530334 [Triticum urartu]XP_048555369.1 uncharacterized protein LOC125536229 [Triticum urartu]